MKNFRTVFFSLLLSVIFNYAFSQSTTFEKTLGKTSSDWGNCIRATNDGNFIIGGAINSFGSFSFTEFYLVKINSSGDTLWTRTYENLIASSEIFFVEPTKDSGYIAVGWSDNDIFLLKTDAMGNLQWVKQYGEPGMDDQPFCVRQTSDEGYIIAASTKSYGPADYNMYIIKTNTLGDTSWTRVIGTDSIDKAKAIVETPDSGFLVGGTTWGFGQGEGDAVILKLNKNGDITWVKNYGGRWDEVFNSIEKTKDGGYIIGGETESWLGGVVTPIDSHPVFNRQDMYVIRLNSNYDTLWTRTFGAGNTDTFAYETIFSIQEASDGNFFIAGKSGAFGTGLGGSKSGYFLKINSSGDTIWTRIADGSSFESINSLAIAPDNTPMMVGFTRSFGAGLNDMYILKTDVNGNTSCNIGYPATKVGTTTTVVGTSNPFQISSGATFSVPALQLLDSTILLNELCECFVSVSITFSTPTDTICNGDSITLTATSSGNKFLWNTGDTTSTVTVFPSSTKTYSVIASNDSCSSEATLMVNVQTCVGLREFSYGNKVVFSPNLFSNYSTLQFSNFSQYNNDLLELNIYDYLGKKIRHTVINKNQLTVYKGNLPNGLYIYEVTKNKNSISRGKIIIQ